MTVLDRSTRLPTADEIAEIADSGAIGAVPTKMAAE